MGVNPERKSGLEHPKAVGNQRVYHPGTPAANPAPCLMLCVPTELLGTAERATLISGQHKVSIYIHPVLRFREATLVSPLAVTWKRLSRCS